MRGLRAFCDAIRNNDPSVTEVTIPVCNRRRVGLLLKVLQGNTAVQSLVLDVTFDSISQVKFRFAALLQYLKQSESIRAFKLLDRNRWSQLRLSPERVGLFLRALAENPFPLDTFNSNARVSCESLVTLLQGQAHCLKHLSIPDRYIVFDSSPRDSIAEAGSALSVLEFLEVDFTIPGYEFMLASLCTRPCLRKLLLVGSGNGRSDRNMITSLSTLLRSGIDLETLALKNIRWNMESMNSLLQGLESCQSIVKLSVHGYCTDPTGSRDAAFVEFVRRNRSIRHLYIKFSLVLSENPARMAASVLSASESAAGSSLQAVGFDFTHCADAAGVLKQLTETSCRLSSLTLCGFSRTCWSQLTLYLPHVLCLRELALPFHADSTFLYDKQARDDLVRAWRENGTIRTVSCTPFCFSTMEESQINEFDTNGILGLQRIQTYCDRNRLAPKLLRKLCLNEDSTWCRESQTLVPSILKVVAHAPRTAPTVFFTGLLVSFDSIGPNRAEHLHRRETIDCR
jgi:hypothetical protein